MTVDYAFLWESQLDMEGRVFFFTDDDHVHRFASRARAAVVEGEGRGVVVMHMDVVEERINSNKHQSLIQLWQSAESSTPAGPAGTGTSLSAQLFGSVLQGETISTPRDTEDWQALHRECLHEALSIQDRIRPFLQACSERKALDEAKVDDAEQLLQAIDDANPRWKALLARGVSASA